MIAYIRALQGGFHTVRNPTLRPNPQPNIRIPEGKSAAESPTPPGDGRWNPRHRPVEHSKTSRCNERVQGCIVELDRLDESSSLHGGGQYDLQMCSPATHHDTCIAQKHIMQIVPLGC